MLNLIQNEWIKIFRQVGTYIMLGLLVLLLIGTGVITKIYDTNPETVNDKWKEQLIEENVMLEQNIEEMPLMKEYFTKELAINNYRIQHDLPPENSSNVWTFMNESVPLISVVGLLVIIIAAGIVANEFTWGTIKVLLIKPFYRWKILLAKYVTTVLFLLLTLLILFVTLLSIGAILLGTGGDVSNIHLAYTNGTVVEQSIFIYLIKVYLLNSLSVFLLATMAFMISATFRVSGLAIGISIFLLLMGGTVTNLLASKFEWAKYSLFANTNLMQYIDGSPMVEGMTMSFSITMMIVYFLIFHACAFVFFTKRDVAT